MKRKISMFELLQVLSQLALTYIQYHCESKKLCTAEQNKSQMLLLVFILTISILKTKLEGNRMLFILWIPTYILSLFHKIFHTYTSIEVIYLSAFISFIYIILTIWFPIYEIPQVIQQCDESKTSPFYNVSCTSFPLDEEATSRVTVYYPTEDQTGRGEGDLNMLEADYWDYHFKCVYREFKVPSFLLNLVLSGLKKYKVKVEANHAIIPTKNLKPIIFSHGYMGSRTMYSIITKQLAALGYVIFCVEHYDKIRESEVDKQKDRVKKRQLLKQIKEIELEVRTSKIKAMIDLIQNEMELNKLFGQSISLDKNNITLMGHSYGGATAQCSAFKYPENVKALICLDPWHFPMKDSYLDYKLNIPTLYINSETFSGTMKWAEIEQRNSKIFANSLQKQKSLNCYIKSMDHIQQGDIGLAIPYEAKLVNLIKYPQRTLEFNLYNAKLAELFLQNIVFTPDNKKDEQIKDNEQYLNEKIFKPLKRDSYQYFRQEFVHNFDQQRDMYCLDFRGKSPF